MGNEHSKKRRPKGSTRISVEAAAFAVFIPLMYQRHPELLNLVTNFLRGDEIELPSRDEFLLIAEPILKEAAEVISFAQLLECYLRKNTAEAVVSYLYIVNRALFKGGAEPTKEESTNMWQKVWDRAMASRKVRDEAAEMEQRGDLDAWKEEIQNKARRQWRTVRNQVPHIQHNSLLIFKSLMLLVSGQEDSPS
jgi:hypothetical protein